MSEYQDDPIRALIKEKKNRSKIGQVRELLPSIQDAHAAGVSLERIVAELHKMGIEVTYAYLRNILYRIRNNSKAEKNKPNETGTNLTTISTQNNSDKNTSEKETKIKAIDQEDLTPKQRREKIADLFVSETKISPRLQRILEKKNESSSN